MAAPNTSVSFALYPSRPGTPPIISSSKLLDLLGLDRHTPSLGTASLYRADLEIE